MRNRPTASRPGLDGIGHLADSEAPAPESITTDDAAEKHHTVKDVADILNISEQTVYQLCSRKKLRHLRFGVGRGTLRIPASALDELVAQATVRPDAPAEPSPRSATSAPPGAKGRFRHVRWSDLPDEPHRGAGRS